MGSLLARLASLVLLGLGGCSAPSAPASSPVPEPTAPSTSWEAISVPEVPTKIEAIHVRYTLRARSGGERDLALEIKELSFNKVVATIAPHQRCEAIHLDNTSAGGESSLAVGCGGKLFGLVTLDLGQLRVRQWTPSESGSMLPFDEQTAVIFHAELPDPAPAQGCQGGSSRPLVVKPAVVPQASASGSRPPPGRALSLRIPELEIDPELGSLVGAHCRSDHVPSNGAYQISCRYVDHVETFEARIQGNVLFFSSMLSGLNETRSTPLGGAQIPCGVSPQFQKFSYLDQAFEAPGGRCNYLCQSSADECEEKCNLEPSEGGKTGPRARCYRRCRDVIASCRRGCKR